VTRVVNLRMPWLLGEVMKWGIGGVRKSVVAAEWGDIEFCDY
jgi:hypothetical protein